MGHSSFFFYDVASMTKRKNMLFIITISTTPPPFSWHLLGAYLEDTLLFFSDTLLFFFQQQKKGVLSKFLGKMNIKTIVFLFRVNGNENSPDDPGMNIGHNSWLGCCKRRGEKFGAYFVLCVLANFALTSNILATTNALQMNRSRKSSHMHKKV